MARGARFGSAAALLLCLLLGPIAASAIQTEPATLSEESVFGTNADGALVNRASGFPFPNALADLPRRRVKIIAANDVMVQYTQRGGGLGDCWLDLIVYPAERSLDEEARDVEAQIQGNMEVTATTPPAPAPAGARDGRSGWFRGTYQSRAFTSGYVLVRRGHWFILVRASNPGEAGEAGMARLLPAIAAIDWAWQPGSGGA